MKTMVSDPVPPSPTFNPPFIASVLNNNSKERGGKNNTQLKFNDKNPVTKKQQPFKIKLKRKQFW